MAASIGSALREARERHGLSIDTVAFELDLEPRHLRSLEEDRLEQELGGVLSSAQAKLYAMFLGLDAKALLAGLPARTLHTTSPAAALTASRAAGGTGADGDDEPIGGSTLLKERDGGEQRIVLDDDDTAELLLDQDRQGPLSRWTRRARRLRPVGARRAPDAAAPVDPPAAPVPTEGAAAWDARWQADPSPLDEVPTAEGGAGASAAAVHAPIPRQGGATRVDPATRKGFTASSGGGLTGGADVAAHTEDAEAGGATSVASSAAATDDTLPGHEATSVDAGAAAHDGARVEAGATRVDPAARIAAAGPDGGAVRADPDGAAVLPDSDGAAVLPDPDGAAVLPDPDGAALLPDADGGGDSESDAGYVDELDDGFADDAYRRRRALALVGGMLLAAVLLSFTVSSLVGQPDEVQLTDGGTTGEPAAPVEQPVDDTTGAPDTASAEAARDETAEDAAVIGEDDAPAEPATVPPADAADTRVQVLDGVGDRQAYQDAIAYLQDLGYQVIRSGGSSREYTETTLFFTGIGEEQASALAAYDGRFAVVRPNDRGLSEQVELHLVVGADWPLTDGVISTTD
jgi:transcriptional regulator with XRE-family HTH domain